MKKISMIMLALVVALGGLGIGYAAWTDTVTVTGTVNTGDVDLVVVDYSGTYVWKTPGIDDPTSGTNDITVETGWMSQIGNPANIAGVIDAFPNDGEADIDPVACATAVEGQTPDDIVVTFSNLFPCIDFSADFLLHYEGSIPVKVSAETVEITGIPVDAATVSYKWYESDETGAMLEEILDPMYYQLHYCDYVIVKVVVHVAQVPESMNITTGVINGEITVTQWNEVAGSNPQSP
jgi:predicted ribosomally synthesized peptide with SipW-like signal peptide